MCAQIVAPYPPPGRIGIASQALGISAAAYEAARDLYRGESLRDRRDLDSLQDEVRLGERPRLGEQSSGESLSTPRVGQTRGRSIPTDVAEARHQLQRAAEARVEKLTEMCEELAAKLADAAMYEPAQIADQASTTNRLPSLVLGHTDLIAEIDSRLSGERLGLTGNYFAGVSIEDCLLRSRSEFERLYPRG